MTVKTKSFRWALVLSALGWSAVADAQGLIDGISTQRCGNGAEIHISGDDLARPRVLRGSAGYQCILEFDANLTGKKEFDLLHYGIVKSVAIAQHSTDSPRVWVVVKLTDKGEPTLIPSADGWILQVKSGVVLSADLRGTSKPAVQGFSMTSIKGSGGITPLPDAGQPFLAVTASTDVDAVLPSPAPISPAAAHPARVEHHAIDPGFHSATGSANGFVVADMIASAAPQPIAEPAFPPHHRKKKFAAVHHEMVASVVIPTPVSSGDDLISLDFAGADVTTIIRAIALQSHESIVVTPDVSGRITVSLDHVSVAQALDTVTAAAGVRYGKVGGTYFVAPADKFADLMVQLGGASSGAEIRVLPLESGRGGQISLAVEKAIPNNGGLTYVLVLPSENVKSTTAGSSGGGQGGNSGGGSPSAGGAASGGGQGGAGGSGGSGGSGGAGGSGGSAGAGKGVQAQQVAATDNPGQDNYIIMVGPANVLDNVEAMVRHMDEDLCKQMGVDYPQEWQIATAVYSCEENTAQNLIAAICETEHVSELKSQPLRTTYGRVEVFGTPAVDLADQKLFLRGPKQEVDRLLTLLQGLDDTNEANTQFSLYPVKYGDPLALREDLLVQVPGLKVTIPAASVSDPQIYQSEKELGSYVTDDASQRGTVTTGSSSGSSSSSSSSSTSSTTDIRSADQARLPANGKDSRPVPALPFDRMESDAVPMRLVLKGTQAQIDRAMEYLSLVDTPPKQVAIEMRVMELTKSDALNAGIDWSLASTDGAVKTLNINQAQSSPSNTATVSLSTGNLVGSVTASLDRITTKDNLIERPNLLVTDGRQTEVFVGDTENYVQSIVSSQNGPTVTTGTLQLGVQLSILPRIGADNTITMDLRPNITFLKALTTVNTGQGEVQLPDVSNRILQSTVTMKSGETIALGGLITSQDTANINGMPFLMNLPILGQLFRQTSKSRDKTELVIFITAREIDGPAQGSLTKLPMQLHQ